MENDLLAEMNKPERKRPNIIPVISFSFLFALFTLMSDYLRSLDLVDIFGGKNIFYEVWLPVIIAILISTFFFFGFKIAWMLMQLISVFFETMVIWMVLKWFSTEMALINRAIEVYIAAYIIGLLLVCSIIPQTRNFFKLKLWQVILPYVLGMSIAAYFIYLISIQKL